MATIFFSPHSDDSCSSDSSFSSLFLSSSYYRLSPLAIPIMVSEVVIPLELAS